MPNNKSANLSGIEYLEAMLQWDAFVKMKKFFIHNRKTIIKGIAILTVAVVAYELAHKLGTAERGYSALR